MENLTLEQLREENAMLTKKIETMCAHYRDLESKNWDLMEKLNDAREMMTSYEQHYNSAMARSGNYILASEEETTAAQSLYLTVKAFLSETNEQNRADLLKEMAEYVDNGEPFNTAVYASDVFTYKGVSGFDY